MIVEHKSAVRHEVKHRMGQRYFKPCWDEPYERPILKWVYAVCRQLHPRRAESKHLFVLAKHAVETAIEQGEEKAMKVLVNGCQCGAKLKV